MIVLRHPSAFKAMANLSKDVEPSVRAVLNNASFPRSLRTAAYQFLAAKATSPAAQIRSLRSTSGEPIPRLSSTDLLHAVQNIHRQTSAHGIERVGTQLATGLASKAIDLASVWERILQSFGAQDVTYLQPEGQRHAVWAVTLLVSSAMDRDPTGLRRLMRALPGALKEMPSSEHVVGTLACLVVNLVVHYDYAYEHLWAEVIAPMAKTLESTRVDLVWKLVRPQDLALDVQDVDVMMSLAAIHLRTDIGAQRYLRLLRDLGDDATTLRRDLACDEIARAALLSQHWLLEGTLSQDTLLWLVLGVEPSETAISNALEQILVYAPARGRHAADVYALRMRVLSKAGGRSASTSELFDRLAATGGLTTCAPDFAALLVRQLEPRALLEVSARAVQDDQSLIDSSQLIMTGIGRLSDAMRGDDKEVNCDLLSLLVTATEDRTQRLETSDRQALIDLADVASKRSSDLGVVSWRILQYLGWRSDLWAVASSSSILESAASANGASIDAILSLVGSAPPQIVPPSIKSTLCTFFDAPPRPVLSWDSLPNVTSSQHDLRPRPTRLVSVDNKASISLTDFDARFSADLIALNAEEIAEAADAGEAWLQCRSEREIGAVGGGLAFPLCAAHARFGRLWCIDRPGTQASSPEESLELTVTSAVIDKAKKSQSQPGTTSATAIEIDDDDDPKEASGKRKREVTIAQQKASKRRRSSLRSSG